MRGVLGFSKNCVLLSSLCGSYRYDSVKAVHVFRQYEEKRPRKILHGKVKKSDKFIEMKAADPKVYMRNIINSIYNVLRNSTWDHAQGHLEMLPIRWDSYTINQVLKTHPPMEKAWLFFNWASSRKGFKHDHFTYTTMLDIFGEAGRISSMNHLFIEMQEKEIKIDAVTYTSMMHWLSSSGDVEGAIKLWDEMKTKDCSPTLVSYTAFMKILFDNGRAEEAINVYEEMLQFGLSPNCHTYTVLMEFLMESGKYEKALEILYKMQEAGVHPDKAACNILIQKCSKAGQAHVITKILEYMKENRLVLRHPVFLEAFETLKSFSYSNALLREVNPHISTESFSKELIVSLTANTSAILEGGLMSILLRKENLIAVDRLLAGLIDEGVKLDSSLISTVIDVNCSRNRPDGVLLAFEYCLKMGVILQRNGYLNLIGILIRSNLFSKVLKVVEEMIRGGYSLEVYFAALLIYKLGKARRTSSAMKVFNLLPDEHKCSPTYTALISAYFCAGSVDKALQIWKTMKEKGIAPSLGTNAVILAGLRNSKRVRETEIYRKEINNFQIDCKSQAMRPTSEKICDLLFGGSVLPFEKMKQRQDHFLGQQRSFNSFY